MSKPSRRSGREEAKKICKEIKRQQKLLRERRIALGFTPSAHATYSNATCSYTTVAEEMAGRTNGTIEHLKILRAQLPQLLKDLNKIKDPRNPRKIKYSLRLLMLYGLLMFVFHVSSRREANKNMTTPQFKENLRLFFPELEELPHADTLFRLLSKIEADQIEQALIAQIKRLIANKKFARYLINNCYPIAIDGTQKMSFDDVWCDELLQRKKKKKKTDNDEPIEEKDEYQYYVYVLEANLCFHNGMVIPLLSEFLEFEQGDMENNKQDCELRAFKRLAERLKGYFPSTHILLLLDGLYANGPLMAQCEKYHWQYMIVLKDKSLPSVWEQFDSLLPHSPENTFSQNWGNRHQQFQWVNNIEYHYGAKKSETITLHMVTCDEQWEVVNKEGDIVTVRHRHVWLSSRPLNRLNVHTRCNLGGRHRWGIEACILVEKHQGYQYEHGFALDWDAMKGYHYLMRLAHVFNTLARFSQTLSKLHRELGVRGVITFIYTTLTGPWLMTEEVAAQLNRPFQLRLE